MTLKVGQRVRIKAYYLDALLAPSCVARKGWAAKYHTIVKIPIGPFYPSLESYVKTLKEGIYLQAKGDDGFTYFMNLNDSDCRKRVEAIALTVKNVIRHKLP